MRRFVSLLTIVLLIGCAQVTGPQTPIAEPNESVIVTSPDCQLGKSVDAKRVEVLADGILVGALPLATCRLNLPQGQGITLQVITDEGQGEPITVTGLLQGQWDRNIYRISVITPGASQTIPLGLDLSAQGMPSSLTYTFTSRPPVTYTLETAATQTGLGTPVPANGFISLDHPWLKFIYSNGNIVYRNLQAERLMVQVSSDPDADGFSTVGLKTIYRGALPQLQRVTRTGKVTGVSELPGVPQRAHYNGEIGAIMYQVLFDRELLGYTMDVRTGQVKDGPVIDGAHGFGETWVTTPDGKWLADLELPGGPDFHADRVDLAALVIREGGKEVSRVKDWLSVYRGDVMCSDFRPGFAWRPDGQAIAAVSAPKEGTLQLLVYDRATGKTRVLAERAGKPTDAFFRHLTWAPGGRYLTFGSELLDAQTGRVIASGISTTVHWSPAGEHLLVSSLLPGQRNWGRVALIQAATGERQELGYGMALPWTEAGEALLIHWDASQHLISSNGACG